MQFDNVPETLVAWMEIVRAWVLEQTWLSFVHDWINSAAASTIWAILVIATAGVILLIGYWPAGKPKSPQ
jgi:hypothetical protein